MYLLPFKSFLGNFIHSLGVLLLYIVLGYVLRSCILRYEEKFKGRGKFGIHAFLKALANPVFLLSVLIGLTSSISMLDFMHAKIVYFVSIARKSSFLMCSFWFVFMYIDMYEKRFYQFKDKSTGGFNKRTVNTLTKFGKALAIILAIMILMDIFGVDIRGILTVAGIGGAALGFASKDLLANFFGSIIIFIDKPFAVGDWVKLSNGKEGEIEYIGWRVTKLRGHNTMRIYISNAFFSNMVVENYSMITHRKIEKIIKLKSLDIKKIQNIMKDIKTMLAKQTDIDLQKGINCFISELNDPFINCEITAFTTITDKFEFREFEQKLTFELAKIIKKHKLALSISNQI